jgi:pyrroline-5-carboxylate reductase
MVEKPPADWRAARMRRTGARRTGTRRTGTKARRKQKGSQAKPRSTQTKATVFLGGGRITGALIAGLRLAGYDGRIVVHDHNPGKLRALRREYRIEAAGDLKSAVAQADVLIVAVRPLAVADLLNEVARSGIIRKPILAISLAAGIPIKKLRARLGRPVQWTRAMPSPVCRIGRGLTAVTFDRQVPKPSRERVREFFARVGPVLELPENGLDIFTATFSPSHGYHAMATLAKAAENAGFARGPALTSAAHALADSIFYWRQSGENLDALLSEASTPGGTAAATIRAMDDAGYARAVARGLRAGVARGRKNAR